MTRSTTPIPLEVPLHTLEDRWHEVRGLRVLVRVDLNIPIDTDKSLLLDLRLQRAARLARQLQFIGCRVILISHWGRPEGKPNQELSLRPFIEIFARLFGLKVTFLPTHRDAAIKRISRSQPGSIFLLENLRFHPGEEIASLEFAQELANLADCFIMDAFSVSHRAHASVVTLPQLLPTYVGPSFAEEYRASLEMLKRIRGPLVMMAGGRKLDKLMTYRQLMPRIDKLLIGSGFAPEMAISPDIFGNYHQLQGRLVIPSDVLVSEQGDEIRRVELRSLKPDDRAIDIGPDTAELFCKAIRDAGTLLFNGALGLLPSAHPMSSHNTILKAIAESQALKIVCGGMGCRLFASSQAHYRADYLFLGGGSTLAFLATRTCQALPYLMQRRESSFGRLAMPGLEGWA